jgi:hypothetical protein
MEIIMSKKTRELFRLVGMALIFPLLFDVAIGQSSTPQDQICRGPYRQLQKEPIFTAPPASAGAKIGAKSSAQFCMSGLDQDNFAKVACIRSIQTTAEKPPAQFLCPLNHDCLGGGTFTLASISPDPIHQGKSKVCLSFENSTPFEQWVSMGIW